MKRNVLSWSVFGKVKQNHQRLRNSYPLASLKLAFVAMFCLVLHLSNASAAQKKILFYGPTYNANGKAEQLVETSEDFYHVNIGTPRSEVWTPGDPNAAKDWSKKTTADFQNFDAIVFGDIRFDPNPPAQWRQISDSTIWAPAIANVAVWSAAVTGNVLLFAGDPEAHAGDQCANCGGNKPLIGAEHLIQNGIRFAAAAGHGLYLPLSAVDPNLPSPINPTKKCIEHLLSGLGNFTVVLGGDQAGGADQVRKLYQTPEFSITTETELSEWDQSAHSGFTAWPSGYKPLALVTDVGPESQTPSGLLPAGEKGLVHILAKSSSLRLFYLSPAYSGRAVGTSDSFTAYFKDSTGAGISSKTVSFSLISGSANSPQSGSGATGLDGSIFFSSAYPGSNSGRDNVEATVTDTDGTVYKANRTVDWANNNIVTISSTTGTGADPNAGEPATSGGVADTGTFIVSRSGLTTSAIEVNIRFFGTATQGTDYTAPTTVTLGIGVSSATLTVTPTFDGLSEVDETVVARVVDPDVLGSYAIGSPSEATVTIASSTKDTITLTVIDSSLDESGNNKGQLKLHRAGTSGDAFITLQFSGSASFGDDYIIEGLELDNTAKIPDTQQDFYLMIDPVPDSRWEGTESVTITVMPSPNGSYAVGTPSTQTLNISEDDVQQLPLNGWKITDIGVFGGTSGNAVAINSGGKVVWDRSNSNMPYTLGVLWDNGSSSYRNYPSSWSLPQGASPWSEAWGLNDDAVVVGNCTWYHSSSGYHGWASYWNAGTSTPILLPVLHSEFSTKNYAYDINQRDYINDTGAIIVGTQKASSSGNTHAVMWLPNVDETYTSNGLADLSDLGSGDQNSFAYAINQWGEVVGKSQILNSTVYHAFRSDCDNGIPRVLAAVNDMGTATFADGHTSEANDINKYGELVGASQFPGNYYHAAYKSPDTLKNLGWYRLGVLAQGTSNAGTASVANGINDKGIIVGNSLIKVNNVLVWHGFVVSNQGTPGSQALLDLNDNAYVWTGSTWLTAAQDGWIIQTANKVNESNWIAGYGVKNGVGRAIVLSPR